MTNRQFQIETERRLWYVDPETYRDKKLTSDEIFSLLNDALDKFWKTRYSGINFKAKAFEQDQKRIDDLRTLIKTKTYTNAEINSNVNNKNEFNVDLPSDYVILLGDIVGILPKDDINIPCWDKDNNGKYITKYNDTIESSIETIDRQLNNPLSEHRLKHSNARPLRLIQNNSILLYTDDYYKVSEYRITYLSKPSKLSLDEPTTEYTDLPEHTHLEIVKLAVQIYLSKKGTENYNSYSNEIKEME